MNSEPRPTNSQAGVGSPAPLLVDSRTAAKMLAISERTLWTLTQAGEISAVRIGRAVRYDPEDLRAWIHRQKASARA